jgi:hypothetical protein
VRVSERQRPPLHFVNILGLPRARVYQPQRKNNKILVFAAKSLQALDPDSESDSSHSGTEIAVLD